MEWCFAKRLTDGMTRTLTVHTADSMGVSSPIDRYSPVTTTKKVVEKRSNYKYSNSYSGSQEDQGSPYSSLETDRARRLGSPSAGDPGGKSYLGRKDSWDSVEKTRQMLGSNRMPIQAPQWTDYLNCPVCCREFGAPPRSPISLSCGHTICKHCLLHLHRRQCPFDQTVINLDPEELVVNTALLQLAGVPPPAQPYHPPSVAALPEAERRAYDVIVRRIEDLALYLKYCGNATNSSAGGRLSRPMQRKLVSLVQCVITDEEGRGRAARAARSLGERTVTELILQHQNPQQLSANLWAAVRARGCQFLGPAMQEEVLKLVLLALEDGSALSRKVLVMFVVQRLEPTFPQASKTSIGHVVQLLYRASCFKVSKRQSDSSLMQLKEEFRTYESLRREHDAQIVQIATEAGLRIAPDQWSALLYGDTAHKSHMQSIIDKLQTPQSFAQSVQELFIALQRTGDPAQLVLMSAHLDRLAGIDATPDANSPSWGALGDALTSLLEVVSGLVHYLQQQASSRDANHNQRHAPERAPDPANSQTSPSGSTPTHGKYKVSMCRDAAARAYCPRGNACTFAHSEEELERFRSHPVSSPGGAGSNGNMFMVPRLPQPLGPLHVYPPYPMPPTPNNFSLQMLPPQPIVAMPGEFNESHEGMQNTNYPTQNMMNGQLVNGMPINQNGLMPMMERATFEPPPHPGLQYNNNMAPYSGLLAVSQHPPSSQSYTFAGGFPGPVPAPGQKPPQMTMQAQAQVAQTQVMHTQVPVMQNMFVPIQPEMKNPSRDLSPYPFDELQSDLFSDSYRVVAASRYGLGRTSPSWAPATEHVFNFDKLSGALPRVSTADDVFNVGERMAVGATSSSANIFSHPDDELEEEIQALERRLDKELDK